MNLSSLATDNVTELLVKVMEFTRTRHEILGRNITGIHGPGFAPKDLPVDEFSGSLSYAVDEHIRNDRLVFCDTENVKFGTLGAVEATPRVDEDAKVLFETDRDKYLQLQMKKLFENSLNHRAAAELLKQKQATLSNIS